MAGGGAGTPERPESTYSPMFAFVYIFNLIIGVGALSLPKAFSEAGLALGTILIVILCFMSFMTATYMVEAMAAANAYYKFERQRTKTSYTINDESVSDVSSDSMRKDRSESTGSLANESTPLIGTTIEDSPIISIRPDADSLTATDDYEIVNKFEMGTMANMFYHPVGIVLYYVCLCLYLIGDLAIYATAIPKSLRTAVCPGHGINWTDVWLMNQNHSAYTLTNSSNGNYCFGHVTETEAYYLFLAITIVVLCPWTFFNLTRSKYLQLVTTIMRNVAFILMVALALYRIGTGNHSIPPAATLKGFPVLFGVSIYSFMCQHSLPGMITPMRSKKNITLILLLDYCVTLGFYLLISYTGAFAFSYDALKDLYTLNFFQQHGHIILVILGYYLALFPVFTLSTNFPIISITLRENLKALFRLLVRRWYKKEKFPFVIDRIFFPLLALIPPLAISFGTTNLEVLVSITGSFPGVGVQYVIPATMAFAASYVIKRKYHKYENKHRSPFGYRIFLLLVIAWTVISVFLIIADDIIKILDHSFTS